MKVNQKTEKAVRANSGHLGRLRRNSVEPLRREIGTGATAVWNQKKRISLSILLHWLHMRFESGSKVHQLHDVSLYFYVLSFLKQSVDGAVCQARGSFLVLYL